MWLASFPEEERAKAAEAMQLFKEANRVLDQLDEKITIRCIFRLCRANADGDDLLIDETRFPCFASKHHTPTAVRFSA